MFGRALEGQLHEKTKDAKNEASRKNKEQAVMNRWLYIDGHKMTTGRFADPMARTRRLT